MHESITNGGAGATAFGDGNVYTASAAAGTTWEVAESARLRTMDGILDSVMQHDLDPVIGELQARADGRPVTLLDIGSGAGTSVEDLATENGVTYYAFDGSQPMLDQRSTPPERKILGRMEDMSGIPDGAFDITYTRAATAWSKDPDSTIADQLRITGERAVFTEYDWSEASVASNDPKVLAAGMAARDLMMLVLEIAGFKTEFGKDLAERVARVAVASGQVVALSQVRHELPVDDHRDIFVASANTLLALLGTEATGSGAGAAKAKATQGKLTKYLRIVEEAPAGTVSVRIPALSTVVVHKSSHMPAQ
ncbi:MAG TPA: methyltransferase domain-containing protein [Candidatus Saccharimonadales bacterium]|nr:methyltransferase domain-containing protein [Candidatus Saccharimonadales bacterium]